MKGEITKRDYELADIESEVQRKDDTIRTLTSELRKRSHNESLHLTSSMIDSIQQLDKEDIRK